jgi:hypothetical protein
LGRQEGFQQAVNLLWELSQPEPEEDKLNTVPSDIPDSLKEKGLDFD